MVRVVLVVVLASCGRLGFDPASSDARAPSDDAIVTSDTRTPDDAPPSPGDAPLTACSPGVTMPLPLGVRTLVDTCTGNRDLFDGCGPPATREVVFEFTPPATGGYSIRAYNPGTNTIMTSAGRINAACTATTSCAGLSGFMANAGETLYVAFEASQGGCVTVEVLID